MLLLRPHLVAGNPKTPNEIKRPEIIFKCEIEDLRPDHPFVRLDEEGKTIFDTWCLLPDTPMLLPLPKKFHVMEQVKRVVAWEYRLSDDRELYKEEYLALINDSKKWIDYVIANVTPMYKKALWLHGVAANNADLQDMKAAERLADMSLGYFVNFLTWRFSVNPEEARWMKEDAAKKVRNTWVKRENDRLEKIAQKEPVPFRFSTIGSENTLLVLISNTMDWDGETVQGIVKTIREDIKKLGFRGCVFIQPGTVGGDGPTDSDAAALNGARLSAHSKSSTLTLPSGCQVIIHAKLKL